MKTFILLAFVLLVSCRSATKQDTWTFVSMPDFLNVDCDYPQEGWEDALSYILESVRKEGPDFITVSGDLVMGHWDAPGWNDADTIAKYAERYYTAWVKRMNAHGLRFYTSLGDHEIGDDAWREKKKAEAVKIYKKAFADYLRMPGNGPEHMKGTAFWWRHKNALFIAVDVFEEGQSELGYIRTGVTGEQLAWMREVLENNCDVDHRFVLGHTPVLGPVRQWSSSGLMLEEGRESGFWQLMKEYHADAYLCGEVHAMTCTERDGVMQVAHGGLIGYNTRTNYLVAEISRDRIDFTLKEIDMVPSGNRKWQTKNNRPLENVTITDSSRAAGFYPVGLVTIDKSGTRAFTNRKGYFRKELETSNEVAIPVFNPYNIRGVPAELPRILISDSSGCLPGAPGSAADPHPAP